jgi:hypothetical protein
MKKCARDKFPSLVRKPFGIVVLPCHSCINDTAGSQPKYLRSFIIIVVTQYGKIPVQANCRNISMNDTTLPRFANNKMLC